MTSILQRFLAFFNKSEPDPEFVAGQLRKPSGEYAQEVGENMDRVNEPLYDLTLDVMAPQENDRILEIGFGTGQFFDKLFLNESRLQVKGIDYSEKMVETAKDNNQSSIASGKLDVRLGRSDNLPFSDESFDKIFCNMVVYFWEDPQKHLKEIYRVLKPSGFFYTGIRSKKSMINFPFVKYGFKLYEIPEWKETLIQNGFSFVDREIQTDPAIEFKGNELELESWCIVAQKEIGSINRG